MKINKSRNISDTKSKNVMPQYETYIITDNKTIQDGSVINAKPSNAGYARKWVDENEK